MYAESVLNSQVVALKRSAWWWSSTTPALVSFRGPQPFLPTTNLSTSRLYPSRPRVRSPITYTRITNGSVLHVLVLFPYLSYPPPRNPLRNVPLLPIDLERPLSIGLAITRLASCHARPPTSKLHYHVPSPLRRNENWCVDIGVHGKGILRE